MKIVVPLAGKDKNFEARGMIKPLTKVQGKEIIKWIIDSRPFSYKNAIFIILKEHDRQYNFSNELKKLIGDSINIIVLDEMTEGSPQSILKTEHLINNDEELLVDLGDQYLDLAGFKEFIEKNKVNCDGIIPTFESYYYNRGYMIIEGGFVKKVSEKDSNPISTHSTACISYFKKGSYFVKYAKQMILKKRVAANGVYLPSLVYNEMIEDNKKIITFPCELIAPLGTVQGADCFEQINRPLK
jgi:NDP-sugar pyrophosphorylase family protein